MNVKDSIAINASALDVEWVNQPALMGEWCEKLADAKAEVDRAKERRDIVMAELDKEMRLKPEKFGLEKVTESALSNAIKLEERFLAANEEVIEATHEVDTINAVVRALDHKKKALEMLVQLHGQQYFAGPSTPRDLNEELLENQRRSGVRKGVRKRMRRR